MKLGQRLGGRTRGSLGRGEIREAGEMILTRIKYKHV